MTDDEAESKNPSLAWQNVDGEYGLAWRDSRDGNQEIYFTRLEVVSEDIVKIGADMRITDDPAGSSLPDLLFAVGEYGLAWQDYRDQEGTTNSEIYFTRLALDGTPVLGPGSEPFPNTRITQRLGVSTSPSLVWTGFEFGLSWYDGRNPSFDIFFVRVSVDGVKEAAGLCLVPGNPAESSRIDCGPEYTICSVVGICDADSSNVGESCDVDVVACEIDFHGAP